MPAPAARVARLAVEPNALSAPASSASVIVTPGKRRRLRSSEPTTASDRPAGRWASSAG